MIIHCTKKLAAKLTNVSNEPLADANPLGSWHANLYTIDRRNCVMFCHDETRFVLFLHSLKKKDFENLDFWFRDVFVNTLMKLDYETELVETAASLMEDELRYDTVCDRSVQGSMRTVRMYELWGILHRLEDVSELAIYSTSALLNDRPVSTKDLKYNECAWPIRDMRGKISTLTSGKNWIHQPNADKPETTH